MKIKCRIETVDVNFTGEQMLVATDRVLSDILGLRIPGEFFLNGSWRLKHQCCSCGFTIVAGADEPVLTDQDNYKRIPDLRGKNIQDKLLRAFSEILNETKLIEVNSELRLVSKFVDPLFPIPLQIFYYKCVGCGSIYLANYVRGFGGNSERGEPVTLNKMVIQEIALIELETQEEKELFTG